MPESDRRFHSLDIDLDKITHQINDDIQTTQKLISSFKKQAFIQRSFDVMRKSDSAVVATGKNIHDIHPSQISARYCSKLKKDPEDMVTRLELINLVLKGAKPKYKEYYTLFIQATAATTMSEISKEAVGIVLHLQDKVFSLLLEQCQEHLEWLQGKLQENSNDSSRVQAVVQIRKEIEKVVHSQYGFNVILKQLQNGLKSWRERPGLSLNRQAVVNVKDLQLEAMEQGQKMTQEEFKTRFKIPSEIALVSRYSMLLHEQANKMVHLFTVLKADSSYPFFIMGRINMVTLNICVENYRATKDPVALKKIHLEFKNVYQLYSKAVKMIPPTTKSPTDFTVLTEFGNLVHYYFQVSQLVIGKLPAGEGFKNVLKTAIKKVQIAQESGQVDKLIRDLHSDLSGLTSSQIQDGDL